MLTHNIPKVSDRRLEGHACISRLEAVFSRLKQYGLKLKPSKCGSSRRQSDRYLGHVVSQNGVETDQDKLERFVFMARTK